MPSAPDEEDPLSDLRQSFEGDVAPSPTPTERGSGSVRSATAPPPLPTKRSTPERKPEGIAPALPVAHVPRSLDDPFQEPSEPRLPHGLPEEKLEFFRVVLKQKQETLARARALYAQREAEIYSLTEAVNSARAQMDSALAELRRSQQMEVRVTQLQAELQASDQDRRDLSAALAEVEAQVVAMTEAAKAEQSSRGLLGKEFMDAQEALSKTQNELSELAAAKSELAGNLEATQELYQAVTSENQRLSSQLERTTEEIGTLAAERDAAIAERDLAQQQLNDAKARLADLEKSNAAALQKSHSAERWLAEANEKVTAAERTAVEAQKKSQHQERSAAEAQRRVVEFERGLREAQRRAEGAEAAAAKAQQQLEVAERTAAQAQHQLQTTEKGSSEAQRRFRLLEKTASEAQKRAEGLEREVVEVRQSLEEASVALQSERGEREALEERLQQVESQPSVPAASALDADVVAERDKLRADVAALKKKLVFAESAIEAAASLKAKVARLEAQLKKK